MEDQVLDSTTNRTVDIQYNLKNAKFAIIKGILGFALTLSLIGFYLWCNENIFAFSSDHAQSVINGLLIYAILLSVYSVFSILLGTKIRENDTKACYRFEIVITLVQILIAILLVIDGWYSFELYVL